MKIHLIALINSYEQYSPDGFEDCPKIIDIDENTTIGDLIDWHNKEFSTKRFDTDLRKTVSVDPTYFKQIHIIKKSEDK